MPTKYRGTPEEILALDSVIKFTRALTAFEGRLFGHGAIEDLTVSQFGLLEVLYHLGPMCPGTLSQKLLKSTGNMTMVIDNLEKHGLVTRQRSAEDRRMIYIVLTPAGEEKIARILPNHVRAVVEEMSALTPEEQREFGRLCKKLGKKE